ncbi:MmcB family DNA repair protein [Crocosphaera sp.]|uniref:MmcB family DNA repair protein n=1 Tax=Crocosphaera sp. TaxID=2729996 RepID=UPI00262EE411|nr:MmcB family DNA repair protein [Crocosphaera sp.]MDJ0581700.1 MmcB family DNA repair protein [Crocosphaera sp.]
MKIIQLELQLEQVNDRITELLRGKNYHWTEIAKLAIIVHKQELFKPEFTSFTAWVKDIAIRCDRQPSLIWRYIKASRYYLQLVSNVEVENKKDNEDKDNEDLQLERLDEIKAAPEALDRLEKVQRQAPTPVFETLRDKVLNGKATVAECREIEKSYRPSLIDSGSGSRSAETGGGETREGAADYQPSTSNSDQLPLPLNTVVNDEVLTSTLTSTSTEGSTGSSQQNQEQGQGQQSDPLVLPIPIPITITNRGRPKKGQEGTYRHLGQNKINSTVGDDHDHHNDDKGEGEGEEAASLDGGEVKRSQIAPTIVRSLSVNLVDWTKIIASRNYAAKYYQDHTEVRVNFERHRYRLDFLAVVRWTFKRPKDIFVVEIKSCLQDFESDYKWTNYLKFCHYFCFAIPLNSSISSSSSSSANVSVEDNDNDLLNAIKNISDDRIGILGIDFQASIDEFCSYPVTVIKKPKKLDNQKHYGNHTHLVYETLYERVLGWKEKHDD